MPGRYVVLTIADSGIGIAQENLNRIFEPFYTSKIMGRSGTGLGMTVVWGTVKDHDGFLDVKSRKDGGTSISVLLPAARENDGKAALKSTTTKVITRGRGESILLVDDSPEQRSLGHSILTTLGYKVETAAGGEEAVQLLTVNPFDLVLLDMIMESGIDGLDTYRKILDIRPEQAVIIVSGYSESQRVQEALQLGVRSIVKKPYTLEAIATAISNEFIHE